MGLQRYENPDENKFWEIWIDNVTVFMKFGKTGSSGQTKLKKCTNADVAAKEEARFIAEKQKQGFALVSSAAKPKKAAKNPELEKAITADPDSPDGYLVYGDWLTEQADPLGELIAVQANLAKKPKDKTLAKKSEELIKANEASWLGDLMKLSNEERTITWRYGFMHEVKIGGDEYCDHNAQDMFLALRKSPASKFMHRLTMNVFDTDDGEPSYSSAVKAMATNGIPPTLRKLAFDVAGYQVSWTDLGDISKLYPYLEKLEELLLHVGKMKLGTMNLPNLKRLEIKTGGLSKDNVKSVIGGKWPKLETLLLYFGNDEYGCNCKIKDIEILLEGKSFPKVRELALCNSEFEDDIAKAIPTAKITKQLKKLDLSKGLMTDAGAQALLTAAPKLANLEMLDVSENYLSPDMEKQLKKAFGKKIDTNSQGDPNEEYKYVQVNE